jgi:hypothetical protein
MIRRAVIDDVAELVRLAKLEHSVSQLSAEPFDQKVVEQKMTVAILGFATVVFVSENDGKLDGVIAGMAQQNLHNRYSTVYELMWFSAGRQGLKLLDALKDWANRMRATALVVHNYAGVVAQETFTRVMGRKGFDVLGTSYSLKLEN